MLRPVSRQRKSFMTQSDHSPPPTGENPIDLEDLMARVASDRGLACQLARVFLDNLPTSLNRLRRALNEGRAQELAQSAHALKGACLSISAGPLGRCVAELEQAARAQNLSRAAELLPQIEALAAQLEEALRSRLCKG